MTTPGYRLVPEEPTREMCEAAPALPPIHAVDDLHLAKAGWSPKAVQNLKRWKAMLAVAPTPTKTATYRLPVFDIVKRYEGDPGTIEIVGEKNVEIEVNLDTSLFGEPISLTGDAKDADTYVPRQQLDPSVAPGHTDLMVSPESLDAFMEANPLPGYSEPAQNYNPDAEVIAKPEPPADLVERARKWWGLSDYSSSAYNEYERVLVIMAAFAQEHAAAEKARADKAEKALADEREACAKIVEKYAPASQDMTSTMIAEALDAAAAAIRARKGGGDE